MADRMDETIWHWLQGAVGLAVSGIVGAATWLVTRTLEDRQTITTNSQRISALETDVVDLRTDHSASAMAVSNMQRDMTDLKTDVKWIRKTIANGRHETD